MSRGEFDHLDGSGKPLSQAETQNPYVDFTQHKLNQILLDNGFTPEWITLKKEIQDDVNKLRKGLADRRNDFDEWPLPHEQMCEWEKFLDSRNDAVESINRTIDKYNLIVPILNQQLFRIRMAEISEKFLRMKPVNK